MVGAQVYMEVGNDGVALISLSNPPVNVLTIPIFEGLKEKYDEAMKRDDVKAIVVTGENGKFSGGFDLNVIEKVQKTGDLSILPDFSLLVRTIEDAHKPSVAAIEGFALGGGLELAMGCHARISASRVRLPLPELSLGIIPGSGGTQRLPRLIGLEKAVEMMLSSKSILSEEGVKLGLINFVVSPQDLLKVSRLWALDMAEGRKPLVCSLHTTHKLWSSAETREFLMMARQKVAQTARNIPQYQACLDVIEEGIKHGGYSGISKEDEVFKELVLSDIAKDLLHKFFAQHMKLKSKPASSSTSKSQL